MSEGQVPEKYRPIGTQTSESIRASMTSIPHKGKYSKSLDRAIFLTLSIISVAIIAAVLFSNSGENLSFDLNLNNYSTLQVVELEGISIPTLSAIVGERQIQNRETNTISGAHSSEALQYEASGEDLRIYALSLIDDESFIPIELNEDLSEFMLVKQIGEERIIQVRAHTLSGESVAIDYAFMVDVEKYDILTRFVKVSELFVELGLDISPLLFTTGGLNEEFWSITLEMAMDQTGSVDFLGRFLEIAIVD